MIRKIPYIYYVKNKKHETVSVDRDSQHVAWLKADAILRPEVDRTKYLMDVAKLKSEGYYAVKERDDDWNI